MSSNLQPDMDLAGRYADGSSTAAETIRVERALDQSPPWRALVGSTVESARLDENFALIVAELDAPGRGLIERLMVRLGLHEHVARLMAATPVLRRSWYLASMLVLFFGIAASNNADGGSIGVFLAMAPLVPVLGVALAYGPGVDPAHEMTLVTPLSGFRLVLLRSLVVLATSVTFCGVASVLVAQEHGLSVLTWMLPALALTGLTLVASTFVPTRVAAGGVAGLWLLIVAILANAADDLVLFAGAGQAVYLLVAVLSGAMLAIRRHYFDSAGAQA
ncbi:MAG: zf-HC2 domain-containing protein [Acidimicrobiales bacterium]